MKSFAPTIGLIFTIAGPAIVTRLPLSGEFCELAPVLKSIRVAVRTLVVPPFSVSAGRVTSTTARSVPPSCVKFVIFMKWEHQELAVFLTLAIGFFIGRLRVGTFSLGTAVGTLLAGVAIGQLNIQVPAVVRYVFFDLFLFTTGHKVGPQFFRALKKDALPPLAITLVLCVTCLLAAFTAAKFLGYDMGTAAGLLAGAFTESTVIGTAGDAIGRLTLSAAQKAELTNNSPVAYAVTS